MNPSDILNRAADILIERGWVGRPAMGGQPTDPVCAFGAICLVQPKSSRERMAAVDLLDGLVGCNVEKWNDLPETTEAMVIGLFHEAALLAKEAGQ